MRYHHFLLIIVLFLCLSKPVLAQDTIPKVTKLSEATKQIASLLTTKGVQAHSGVQFFQAGINCHHATLPLITYFLRKGGVFFFFNDTLNNCYLAFVPTASPDPRTSASAASCVISDTQYEKMFTPWFLDGLKNYDETQKLNAAAQQFIVIVTACLKPLPDAALLSILLEHKAAN